jgi:hypothetical protein
MKLKSTVLFVCLLLSACGAFSGAGPAQTVKDYHLRADSGNADAMTKLFSSRAIKEKGEPKIREQNQSFVEMVEKIKDEDIKPEVFEIKESVNGDKATVNFRYGVPGARSGSIASKCELVKENGEWKIEQFVDPF